VKSFTSGIRLVALAALLAGCGGKSDAEKQAESQSGRGTVTCDGKALSGEPGLPAGFPILDGVTFVSAKESGPTRVLDGFSTESLAGLYNEWGDRLKEAQYVILFDEIEKDNGDAEISYRSKDGKTSGQIALRAACDDDHVSVHITARPA
jgi:hypothetical protein